MKRLLFLIVASIFLVSCSDPLNKPIYEPLTIEELQSVIKKDTTFIEYYEEVQKFRTSFFTEDINQVKYGDISYNQLQKYFAYEKDTTFTNPIITKAESDWGKKYNHYQLKLDSLSNYWQKYINENSINSYADIEFDHLSKEYSKYSKELTDVKFAFKLTPLKETIQQISFYYKVKSKLRADEPESIYGSIFDDKRGSCILTSPFSRSVVRYWEVNSTVEGIVKNLSTAEFKRDYDITFEIGKIRVKDKNISEDNLFIPEVMEDYLRYPSLYIDDVIKYFFNDDYISIWEFIRVEIDKELKKKDEKCYDFIKAFSDFEED